MTAPKIQLTRRQIIAGAAALPLFSIATRRAQAAEFELKYATGQDPTHPVNIRAKQALDRIREATSGRVDIKLFRPTSSAATPIYSRRSATARSTSSTCRR